MEYQASTLKPKNNSLAVVSLVSGIVAWVIALLTLCSTIVISVAGIATAGIGWLLYCCVIPLVCLPPIGWIVGVITGHIGKNQIKQSGEGGNGMATAGLIMGYVGLGLTIISICLMIVLPLVGVTIPFLSVGLPDFSQ